MDIEGLKKRLKESGCRIPIADVAYDAIEQLQRELDQRLIALSQLNRELEEARKDAEGIRKKLSELGEWSKDALVQIEGEWGNCRDFAKMTTEEDSEAVMIQAAIDAAREKQG